MDNRDRQQWDHGRTASKYASTAALVRHHAETLLDAYHPPSPPPEPVPDPAELTRCPCHGEWTVGDCKIPAPVAAEPEPARCPTCDQELPE